jgi:hypothetical protein
VRRLPIRLTDAQIQEFDREGWLFLPAVLGADEASMNDDEGVASPRRGHRPCARDRAQCRRLCRSPACCTMECWR